MKTGLKVVSILELIIGGLALLFGLINIVLFVAGDGAGASVAGLLMLSLFLLILNGIFDIICGILACGRQLIRPRLLLLLSSAGLPSYWL